MNLVALELALRVQFPLWHSGLSCQLDHKRSHCGERIAARDSCGEKHTDLNRGLTQGHCSYSVTMYEEEPRAARAPLLSPALVKVTGEH